MTPDQLRALAENGSSIRSAFDGRSNALAWSPITNEEKADRLGTLRVVIDREIKREQAQEAAR